MLQVNSYQIECHLWTALNNTVWAFKAEKGSEFIAAYLPAPCSRQQMAENNGLFKCWEKIGDLHCGWYFSKDAQNYYKKV